MKADNTLFDAAVFDAERPRAGLAVARVTPWNEVCGNALYAAKLADGLSQFAAVGPSRLQPAPVQGHFERLSNCINAARPDVVHVQHEYCFFGTDIGSANQTLDTWLALIDAPVAITLHTAREDLLAERCLVDPLAQRFFAAFTKCCHRLRLPIFPRVQRLIARRLRRFDVFLRALQRCRTIVVHSPRSAHSLAQVHPELTGKIRIVPIAVPSLPPTVRTPLAKPENEVWLMMLGFVNEYKGHRLAIESLSHLPSNYRLVIAGGRHPQDTSALDYWCGCWQRSTCIACATASRSAASSPMNVITRVSWRRLTPFCCPTRRWAIGLGRAGRRDAILEADRHLDGPQHVRVPLPPRLERLHVCRRG